uniref:Uncharacterized protein n=1 Tax=Oryza brachyantha TaxID=4533 RepID=J3NCI9_ORYBR
LASYTALCRVYLCKKNMCILFPFSSLVNLLWHLGPVFPQYVCSNAFFLLLFFSVRGHRSLFLY